MTKKTKKQPKSLKPRDWSKITEKMVKFTEKIPIKKAKPKKDQTLEQVFVNELTKMISDQLVGWAEKNDKCILSVNRARCTVCGDIIESKSVHHLARCKCGRIFVDGGHDYQRTGFKKITDIEIWDNKTGKFKPLR
jgi:hypothetical protein